MLRSKSKLLRFLPPEKYTLQGTNISQPGKSHLQKCLGGGYANSQEGIHHWCCFPNHLRVICLFSVHFWGLLGPSSQPPTRWWKFPASPNHDAPGRSFFVVDGFDGWMTPVLRYITYWFTIKINHNVGKHTIHGSWWRTVGFFRLSVEIKKCENSSV